MTQLLGSLTSVVIVVLAFKAAVIQAASRRTMTEWAATWVSLLFVFLFIASAAWLTVSLLPMFSDGLVACSVAGVVFVVTMLVTSVIANRFGLRAPVNVHLS